MKLIESMIVVLLAVFAPIGPLLLVMLVMCIADLITGIIASKGPVTSSGIKRTVVKLMVYEIAIIMAFLVGNYLTGPSVPVLNIVAGMVGLTELKSVLENLNDLSGGSLLKAVVDMIQSKIGSNNGN